MNKVEFKAEWNSINRHLASPSLSTREKVARVALAILSVIVPIIGLTIGAAYLITWISGHLANRMAHKKTLPSAYELTPEQLEIKKAFHTFWDGPITAENERIRKVFEATYHTVTTPDGAALKTVWFRHKEATAETPTLLYFGGNFQIYEQSALWPFEKSIETQTPFHLVTFNYRGVDGSTGTVRRSKNLILDGDAVVQWIRKEIGTLAERIHFYGLSLGGAVALQTQSLNPEELTGHNVNHNSFSHSSRMLEVLFGGGLVKRLVSWLFDWQEYSANPTEAFNRLKGKKLIIANPKDQVIPERAGLQKAVQHSHFFELKPKVPFQEESEKLKHHAAPLEWHEGAIEKVWNFLFERETPALAGVSGIEN